MQLLKDVKTAGLAIIIVHGKFYEVKKMIPRIKHLEPMANYVLQIAFDDGKVILYDVKEDMRDIPDYSVLKTTYGLFQQAQVDESRTCVYWNDEIDLPSDSIYEYGKVAEE